MKKFVNALAVGFVVVSPLLAKAGVGAGGGGNAIVCKSSNDAIHSATSLDLYEGYVVRGLKTETSVLPFRELAELRAKEISKGIDLELSGLVDRTINSIRFLPSGTALTPVNDASYLFQPAAGCQIVQLARYVDQNDMLLINEDVWLKLGEVDRAALIVHEALYTYLRAFGVENSDSVRNTVAVAFSGAKFEYVMDGVPAGAENCAVEDADSKLAFPSTSFLVYRTAAGETVGQFYSIDARLMSSKSIFRFVGTPHLPLVDGQKEDILYSDTLSSVTEAGTKIMIELSVQNQKTTGTAGYIRTGSLSQPRAFTCTK